MDFGELYAGLNALDVAMVKRNPDGTFAGLKEGSETLGIPTVKVNPVTGGDIFYGFNSTIKAPAGITDLSSLGGGSSASKAFELILSQNGVVANGATDDSSALQAAIEQAQATLVDCVFPESIRTIKLNSGITLYADRIKFTATSPITLDFSDMTSGVAISVDSKNTDSNTAPLKNILNYMSGFVLVGGGVAGVTAMKFSGASGKPYFYQVRNVSADNFAITVDLSTNTFGIAFEDVAFRSSTGGTLIQCLTGFGSNYGERYSFTRAMLYNSDVALLNTNASTTFRFINSSFDYCKVMADVRAGRVSLTACHVETNQDLDYLFKLSGNEAAALSMSQCEVVMNSVNRTSYEIFDVTDDVKFGGLNVRDTMISHGGGYSLPTYVRGSGPAVLDGQYKFVSQTKIPFSRFMSKLRPGMDTAEAIAEWAITGTGTVTRDTTDKQAGASSLRFNANAGDTTAAIIRTIEPGQMPSFSYYYRKQGSTTGQGLLRLRLDWQDSKGTTISTVVLEDIDGNVDWTLRRSGVNARPPLGATQYQLRFIKSADTGGTAQAWVDEMIITHA